MEIGVSGKIKKTLYFVLEESEENYRMLPACASMYKPAFKKGRHLFLILSLLVFTCFKGIF